MQSPLAFSLVVALGIFLFGVGLSQLFIRLGIISEILWPAAIADPAIVGTMTFLARRREAERLKSGVEK